MGDRELRRVDWWDGESISLLVPEFTSSLVFASEVSLTL